MQRSILASMAHLTFRLEDILSYPSDFGIRGYANISNPQIKAWYRQRDWYERSMIVATDFYLDNNLIEISFEANKNKLVCAG